MNENQIKSTFSDPEFLKGFLSSKSKEQAKLMLSEKGINVSDQELGILGEVISTTIKNKETLTDEMLNQIIGGANIKKGVKSVIRGTGQVLSMPVRLVSYIVGATISGLPRGFADGFVDVWYDKQEEEVSK